MESDRRPTGEQVLARVQNASRDEVGERAASYRQREGLEPALIPERVMVCMSPAAEAPRVLCTGARIAGRLGARWYAVYVETPREAPGYIDPHDRESLARNVALAEGLGATVVRVTADRPADGLIAFAKREGITHVIFGQSARSRLEILWKGSTLNRFSRGSARRRRAGCAVRLEATARPRAAQQASNRIKPNPKVDVIGFLPHLQAVRREGHGTDRCSA